MEEWSEGERRWGRGMKELRGGKTAFRMVTWEKIEISKIVALK